MTTRNERMISPHANGFKKYNADGIGSPSTTLPRVDFAALNQPWAIKSTTPMVLVHVHRFHQQTKPYTQSTQTEYVGHAQSAQTKPTTHS